MSNEVAEPQMSAEEVAAEQERRRKANEHHQETEGEGEDSQGVRPNSIGPPILKATGR